MPTAIRSIGPLHLEDLEPHRFEDMVRQLAYDFRPWLSIEPTGRGGNDDGYDARAHERVDAAEADRDEEEDNSAPVTRLWLIQCKREKEIGPKKLDQYLRGLPKEDGIYGIVFAAACEFSKVARDLFRERTRELGFSEAYLWGKGEIEDQLFQPKNDHLLFAYCGFSLQLRKRSLKTELRARLVTKRKLLKALESYKPVLIRDASDERYPYLDEDEKKIRIERGRWKVWDVIGCRWDGLHLKYRHHFAFLDKEGKNWDRADLMNDGMVTPYYDPWANEDLRVKFEEGRSAAYKIWNALPENERAWYTMSLVLPYETILEIDIDGDEYFPHGPHIYTGPWINHNPFRPYTQHRLETMGFDRRGGEAKKENRVKKFARPKKPIDDGDED